MWLVRLFCATLYIGNLNNFRPTFRLQYLREAEHTFNCRMLPLLLFCLPIGYAYIARGHNSMVRIGVRRHPDRRPFVHLRATDHFAMTRRWLRHKHAANPSLVKSSPIFFTPPIEDHTNDHSTPSGQLFSHFLHTTHWGPYQRPQRAPDSIRQRANCCSSSR